MKAILRRSLASLVGLVAMMVAPAAFADGETCFNDTDCPGAECGGAVCNWTKEHPQGTADKPYTCNPAGTQSRGSDGWCTTSEHCKCKAQGATCVGVYCTFTKASDAPAGSGGTGAGGSPATAGTGTATAGTGTAGTATAGTGSTTPPAAEESGGCSVASPASKAGGIALALGVIGLGAAFARRRR